MTLNIYADSVRCLLLSEDEQSVSVLRRLLRDLEIGVEHYTDPHSAIEDLVRGSFDSIIVDTDDPAGAGLVLQTVRGLPSNKPRLVIALASVHTAAHLGFGAGAHLAIYKPVSVDRLGLTIRAVRNLIARDRRRGPARVPINVAATLVRDGARTAVLVVDLSEGGAAIRCNESISATGALTLNCWLPETQKAFVASVEVMWQADNGQSGLRFLNLSSEPRRLLQQWLKARMLEEKKAKHAASGK
jgi:DNA-binding NarL/FixJ family response regulator